MRSEVLFVVIAAGGLTAILVLVLVSRWRKVPAGNALVIAGTGREARVRFEGGALVLPIVQKAELLDIRVKLLKVRCIARLRDHERVEIEGTCYVRVNRTHDDVLRVAQAVGCERASQQQPVEELFLPKFTDAFVTVAAHFDLDQLRHSRDVYKDQVIEVIGKDLSGFVLDDVAIDRIESPRPAAHDPDSRARVDLDGNDEVVRLRAEVETLRAQVAELERRLARA